MTPTTMPALPSSRDADDGDDAGAEALLALVGEALQVLHLDARDRARHQLDAGDVARPDRSPPAAAAHGELAARLRQLALEPAAVLDQRGEALGRFVDRRLQQAGDLAQAAALLGEVAARGIARHGLEAAHARRDRAFGDDGDEADVAGAVAHGCRRRARPRTVLLPSPPRAHGDDAHLVAVFLAEQRARAGFDRLVDAP